MFSKGLISGWSRKTYKTIHFKIEWGQLCVDAAAGHKVAGSGQGLSLQSGVKA